ncbi:MAG: PilZ domain-containing protein [Labilithrix sp.]|nr:PilZ domain-containing protein [Labilithrix sp.]
MGNDSVKGSDKRREVRYPARIVARMVRRGENVELLTNDVSFRGAFVRTDAPPGLRQLVRVSFQLPTGELVSAHAMVVHVVTAGDADRVPGAGVQFWGPVQEAKAWEKYVYELKVRQRAGTASSSTADRVRRASERFKLKLDVVVGGESSSTRDISANGMAIRSDSPMPVGTRASLAISAAGHPTLSIDVVVRRRIDEPDFRGLGVEYVDLPSSTKDALMTMLHEHASEKDAIYIDFGDPELH